MKTKTGYHFTGDKLRNGQPLPAVGEWLRHDGDVVPCESGLHMSEHPFDSLQYAPGNLLHKVELRGDLESHGDPVDKWAGRERRIVATIDAEKLLRDFARWSALKVIHLWKAPDVVVQYLNTGDESIRVAARDAAGDAACYAACYAAWNAAWYAARYAAWNAACYAAWDEASYAAWDAARDAARAAQREHFASMVNAAFKGAK